MSTVDRRTDFDQLRGLAMLLGIAFHAALAYSTWVHPLFPTADAVHSKFVDVLIWLPHLFRMPLFFLLAGFAAATLVARRGLGELMVNRIRRILLPFVIIMPLMTWLVARLTWDAATEVQQPSPVLLWLRQLIDAGTPFTVLPTTGHLWFLYYLLIFTILTWCARMLVTPSIMVWLQRARPVYWLLIWPLALVPALASVTAPHPAPESPLPQFWAVAYYGSFYAVGYAMARHPGIGHALTLRSWWWAAALVLYAMFFTLADGQPISDSAPIRSIRHWVTALLEAFLSVWLCLLTLTLGQRFLSQPRSWLRYLSAASYWIYLVHLPLLFWIQYRLMDLNWPAVCKFAFALSVTLSIGLLSYECLIRRTFLARYLGAGSSRTSRPQSKPLPAGA